MAYDRPVLQKDPPTGHLYALCEKCHVRKDTATADLEAAAAELLAAGWEEGRRKGGRRKSVWHCPTCAPRGGGGFGAVSRPNG